MAHRRLLFNAASVRTSRSTVRYHSSLSVPERRLRIHPSVQDALQHGKPVVALESTILAHGLPYPTNRHVAQQVDRILRERGVEPATIGTTALEEGTNDC